MTATAQEDIFPRLCSSFILGGVQERAGLLGTANRVRGDESWGLSSSRLKSNI